MTYFKWEMAAGWAAEGEKDKNRKTEKKEEKRLSQSLYRIRQSVSQRLCALAGQKTLHRYSPIMLRYCGIYIYVVCVSGYDPLTFSFLSFLFFDWVGVLWSQLSKVLKLVRWARRVLFPPVSLQ